MGVSSYLLAPCRNGLSEVNREKSFSGKNMESTNIVRRRNFARAQERGRDFFRWSEVEGTLPRFITALKF